VSIPPHTYRAECGACGHRRAWLTGTSYQPDGRIMGAVLPNRPGGPLLDPCPSCGTTDPVHVRRCWNHGPFTDGRWRYVGVAQPGHEHRIPLPAGEWPTPVQLPDRLWPGVDRQADQHDGALPPVGAQLTIGVAA